MNYFDIEYTNETDYNKYKQNCMVQIRANDDTISFKHVETLSGKQLNNYNGLYEKFHVLRGNSIIGIFKAFKDKNSNYMNFLSGPSD